MSGTLVLVCGKDPLSPDPGHSSYVRAHARAACRAGYRPLLLGVGTTPAVTETEFGTVVRIGSRLRPVRNVMVPGLGPVVARALARLARARPEPLLAHGFAVWSYAAVAGCERLRADGRTAIAIMSAYATHPAESASQLLGVDGEPLVARASYAVQAAWGRTVIARYERRALEGAAAVYANYDCVRRLVRDSYGAGLRIGDLPYASEDAFVDRPRTPDPPPGEVARLEPREAPLVISLSSHNGRKGVDVLIDALALARDRGTPLRACLLGSGRLLAPHRRRIAALGLERSVVAPGWVDDRAPYVTAANLFALPSRAEQSGSMAVLDALGAGLAVVASEVDGVGEDLTDGADALLVPPGDVAALAGALTRLATEPQLRARISAAGRATFDRRFSADGLSRALAAVYAEHGLLPAARARIGGA